MNFNKLSTTIVALMFCLGVTTAFAQPEQPDDALDAENADLNPAPIGDYVLPMLLIGVVTAYILVRRKQSTQTE